MRELKTRSQHLNEDDPLKAIFQDAKEDSKDFSNSIQDLFESKVGDETTSFIRKIEKGLPDKVKVPKLLKQEVSKFIRIIHGFHKDDYVWHIEHAAIRRPWRISEDEVLYRISRIMNDHLPDIEIKIWLPQNGWELRTFTYKAMDFANHWAFDEEVIEKVNNKLFEHLNTIV